MKRLTVLIVAIALVLVGSACDKDKVANTTPEDPIENGGQGNSEEGPVFSPAVKIVLTSAEEMVGAVANRFGIEVFNKLQPLANGENVVFSPLSLSLALAMVAEGAEGETYKQFSNTIGWGNASREEVASFYGKMITGLVEADRQVSFSSSNSLWAAKDLGVKESYLKTLSNGFSAEGYAVDFSLSETLDKINAWCSSKTEGKIRQLLSQLDDKTRMMLINALLFKAPWGVTLEVKNNRDFQTETAVISKDYLWADTSLWYSDYDKYEIVGIPYGNGAYEMDIVLPKKGVSSAEAIFALNPQSLACLHLMPVELYFPKFSLEFSTESWLPSCLKELGMVLPFSEQANFSGISTEQLNISTILQKIRLDVTENGTEFAALTGIAMVGTVYPGEVPEKVVVDVNHPFAYIIRETSSNAILLLGTLSK